MFTGAWGELQLLLVFAAFEPKNKEPTPSSGRMLSRS